MYDNEKCCENTSSETTEMSRDDYYREQGIRMEDVSKYHMYLRNHEHNIRLAFDYLMLNSDFTKFCLQYIDPQGMSTLEDNIKYSHDSVKWSSKEEVPYIKYFYTEKDNPSKETKDAFDAAWLHHIHCTAHHWEHWLLVSSVDKSNMATTISWKALDMPFIDIVEMVCDWWSFSFNLGNQIDEVLVWYEQNKKKIILSDNTREIVERLLGIIKDTIGYIKKDFNITD